MSTCTSPFFGLPDVASPMSEPADVVHENLSFDTAVSPSLERRAATSTKGQPSQPNGKTARRSINSTPARGFQTKHDPLLLDIAILNFVQRTIVVQSCIPRVYCAGTPGPAYTSTPTLVPFTKLLMFPGVADIQRHVVGY